MKCLDLCDLNELMKPENADNWLCNKPIENEKVKKLTKCRIVCQNGFDFVKGENQFHNICCIIISVRANEWPLGISGQRIVSEEVCGVREVYCGGGAGELLN